MKQTNFICFYNSRPKNRDENLPVFDEKMAFFSIIFTNIIFYCFYSSAKIFSGPRTKSKVVH